MSTLSDTIDFMEDLVVEWMIRNKAEPTLENQIEALSYVKKYHLALVDRYHPRPYDPLVREVQSQAMTMAVQCERKIAELGIMANTTRRVPTEEREAI